MLNLRDELDAVEKMKGKLHTLFPSYITHIRFPRFKNLAPGTNIDFSFPITALVGANGSGKTSVLHALYGAPLRYSTGEYWFSTQVDPIEEGDGSPSRFIYGHYNSGLKAVVETRKARVRKVRDGKSDPNYWEPTKEAPGDGMLVPEISVGKDIDGRSKDRWNPVMRKVIYINFRKELSAFDKYFYFGKDPIVKPLAKGEKSRRITSKKELIMRDAKKLSQVLSLGDTSLTYRGMKVATENRLLTKTELEAVSFILGREYSEARVVRHRLFKGDGNLSVIFKTNFCKYSEAFAGSGEVAVTSCVIQILGAKIGSLILLDEPEVSLHPGAQERLLAFLAKVVKEKKVQVIFSTHSPHLISSLPNEAIKSFVQLNNGSFSVIPESHPYAAFHRLGAFHDNKVVVLVEDRLAQLVVNQSLLLIKDEALRKLFSVEFLPGGSSTLLSNRIPVLMDNSSKILVLLDGDQRKVINLPNPNEIPESQNGELEKIIWEQIGAKPNCLIDGGTNGGNKAQRIEFLRKYMTWVHDNLRYLPLSSPEEIVLKAANQLEAAIAGDSQLCKDSLEQKTAASTGSIPTSEQIDHFGNFLLGSHRDDSDELIQIASLLKEFSGKLRPAV